MGMTQYDGNPLRQPVVEVYAPNGESIDGVVVKAHWLEEEAEFDMDAEFVVKTDDGELIKVSKADGLWSA